MRARSLPAPIGDIGAAARQELVQHRIERVVAVARLRISNEVLPRDIVSFDRILIHLAHASEVAGGSELLDIDTRNARPLVLGVTAAGRPYRDMPYERGRADLLRGPSVSGPCNCSVLRCVGSGERAHAR